MRVAIVGFGWDGQAAWRYWSQFAEVVVHDQNPDVEVPEGVQSRLGEGYLQGLDAYDLVVRFQGMRREKILDANPGLDPAKVINSTDEFFRASPTSHIIGVTGTKGKGTTTALIGEMLKQAGRRVHVGGNIGTPALDLLPDIQPDDWVVLELSSFQLMDITHSPSVAVCLSVTPDHLDWHTDFAEYAEAKGRIFAHQSGEDTAVYHADNEVSRQLAQASSGRKLDYSRRQKAYAYAGNDSLIRVEGRRVCQVEEVGLRGPHNLENVCAALAATYPVTGEVESLARAVRGFTGLEHRLQLAGEIGNVRYYDDSFATTPETAMAAVNSFDSPQVVILGGSDKGSDFTELARAVAGNSVTAVIVIGVMAPTITSSLQAAGFTGEIVTGCEDMSSIVTAARSRAEPGSVVLLSPACASFGMFADYKDRGNQFAEAVAELSE